MTVRLAAIENLLGRLASSMTSSTSHPPPLVDHASPDFSLLTASGEEIFHPRAAEPEPRLSQPQKPPPSGLFPANVTSTGSGRYGWGVRGGRPIHLNLEENIELRDVLQTLSESGVFQGHLEWLIAGVPGRRMADGLVELYFRDIE